MLMLVLVLLQDLLRLVMEMVALRHTSNQHQPLLHHHQLIFMRWVVVEEVIRETQIQFFPRLIEILQDVVVVLTHQLHQTSLQTFHQ